MLGILFEENKLQEIVLLVGEDVLPDDQRLILEIAKVLKIGFLQQNAFHKDDAFVPLKKQYEMLKTMELLYDRGLSAVKKGIPISRVRNGEIYEEVIKLKYTIPNDDISKIKEVNKMINDFYDKLESEYSK
jgi:V/A-type H+-transporting ATPase subunit A